MMIAAAIALKISTVAFTFLFAICGDDEVGELHIFYRVYPFLKFKALGVAALVSLALDVALTIWLAT